MSQGGDEAEIDNWEESEHRLEASRNHRDRVLAQTRTVSLAIICVTIPLSLLALWPVVNALAGSSTTVSVDIALGVSIATTIAWGATGVALGSATKQKKRLADRNDSLTAKIRRAEQAKTDAEERCRGLASDIKALRADRETQDDRRSATLPPSQRPESADTASKENT